MNNKIVSTKTTSAIFLAIVLLVGTITAIYPSSFIIKGVNAQTGPEYYDYNSYGPPEYSDNNNYNSYEQDYGMDNYDKKSYRNNDYESEYSSYGNDNYYKSKDSSDTINKIKCTTNNINVNGDITGDVNLGNKGAAEGYLGAYSSNGGSGYDGAGYSKQNKGFECIINNNNNNVIAGGGNDTRSEPPTACELCFVNATVVDAIESTLELPGSISFEGIVDAEDIGAEVLTIEDFCEYIEEQNFGDLTLRLILRELVDDTAGISEESLQAIIECLILAGVIIND